MKRLFGVIAVALAFGAATLDADAARRFGGGGNIGKQRAAPMQRDATPPAAAPNQAAKPAQAAPAQQAAPAAGAAAAAKPGFMSRWGGLLAGLGIGALLASLFGAELGPIVGMILAALLAVAVIALLFKLFSGRRGGPATSPMAPAAAGAQPAGSRPRFAGIGANLRQGEGARFEGNAMSGSAVATAPRASGAVQLPPELDPQAFLRVAKTSFIRLQAANDTGDLADIRDYTTPEMYAEIAMQVQERGAAPQKTEVVNLEAQLLDFATEDGYDIASVRFFGLIREDDASNPASFDEVWHVRRKAGDRKDPWLIAGIQQYG